MFRFKRLHLENFQSFRTRQTIEFASRTFIFGSNSVGKSAIADALRFFGDVISGDATLQQLKRWRTVAETVTGPTVVGVGIEYDENINPRSLLHWLGLGQYDRSEGPINQDKDRELWFLWDIFSREKRSLGKKSKLQKKKWIGTLDVLISVTPDVHEFDSNITSLEVLLDGSRLITIHGTYGNRVSINRRHPGFADKQYLSDLRWDLDWEAKAFSDAIPEKARAFFFQSSEDEMTLKLLFAPFNGLRLSETFSQPMGTLDPDSIPLFEFEDEDSHGLDDSENVRNKYLGDKLEQGAHDSIDLIRQTLTGVVVYPAKIIGAIAASILRVGPLRSIPSPEELTWVRAASRRDTKKGNVDDILDSGIYANVLIRNGAHWDDGKPAWEELADYEGKRFRVNTWLTSLGIRTQVVSRRYKLESLPDDSYPGSGCEGETIKRVRERDISSTPPVAYPSEKSFITILYLLDEKTSLSVGLNDVGVGISQVIPILTSLLEPAVVRFIEQPELHLHPKMQLALADVFAGITTGLESGIRQRATVRLKQRL